MHHEVVPGGVVTEDAIQNGVVLDVRVEECVRREETLLVITSFSL